MSEILCPHCGYGFDKMPVRRRKCPGCKDVVVPQSTPDDRNKRLMTEEEAREAEGLWEQHHKHSQVKANLRSLGIDEDSIGPEEVEELLLKIEADDSDPERQMLAAQYLMLKSSRDGDGEDLLYHAFARQSAQLRIYESAGCTHVQVVTAGAGNGACGPCVEFEGNTYTLTEAQRVMPLPCTKCEGKFGCRCRYEPVFDDELSSGKQVVKKFGRRNMSEGEDDLWKEPNFEEPKAKVEPVPVKKPEVIAVKIVDVNIPFGSLVGLLIGLAIAAIPAGIIVWIFYSIISGIFGALL